MCLAGCERHVRKSKQGGVGGLHGGTIGEDNEDSMSGGDRIGTGGVGAKEIATVARVRDGTMGRVAGNERNN